MSIEEKSSEIRYLTHMIVFPDDDCFVEQLPFIHDINFEGRNWIHTVFHHQDNPKDLVRDLIRKGECRTSSPYPPGGFGARIDHIYTIENHERPTGWFGSKKEKGLLDV